MTRFAWIMVTYLASIGVGTSAFVELPARLIWNVSTSVPVGLFEVRSIGRLKSADLVAVMPPEPLASFLADGNYLPRGVPMLKRVLGLPGQQVCRDGLIITVDGIAMGEALERDSRGRDLPAWSGCRTVADDEIFLMNWQSADSLDGRYFGPLPVNSIIGQAVPLWTDEEGTGRFEWRAPTR